MEKQSHHKVIDADRVVGGIVIAFEDGESVFFSAELLRSALPHAEVISPYVDD
jgi:DUF971 family protein